MAVYLRRAKTRRDIQNEGKWKEINNKEVQYENK